MDLSEFLVSLTYDQTDFFDNHIAEHNLRIAKSKPLQEYYIQKELDRIEGEK